MFSSLKMVISHRRTEGDIKYPARSKHMWHKEINLTVHLILSLQRQSFLRAWITRNGAFKNNTMLIFFLVWRLSCSAFSLHVKDGFPSHRPKSRASKEIRRKPIYYNDVVTSTSHFLHRYLLLSFLVQWQKHLFLNWTKLERKKFIIAALS